MIREPSATTHQQLPGWAVLVMFIALTVSSCGSGSPTTAELGSANEAPPSSESSNNEVPAGQASQGTSVNNGTNTGQAQTGDTTTSDGPIACGPIDLTARLRILDLINEARAAGQRCGSDVFPPAGAVSWNDSLDQAAIRHSRDMATHDVFSHTGTDGSSISDRATDANYNWNLIGENIAAGQSSAEEAIQGWLDSPGHCRNIMEQNFSDMSVACEVNASATYSTYWTQVFGNEF